MSNSAKKKGQAVAVPRGDRDLINATQTARATVSDFINHLRSPKSTEEYFAVKVKLSGKERNEYIWIYDVVYDGESFKGKIGNSSELLPDKKIGDELSVDCREIYDWMFVDDGRLIGGYTLRVARAKMTQEQRAKLDAATWYRID